MQKAGLKATDAQVLNMRPPEIAAAWERGDIDATFIWDPVLTNVKKNGKVLTTSGDICKQGACTFDGLIVTRKFAKENPEFMVALVKAVAKADADYRANAKAWTGDQAKVAAVAKWSGGKPEDVAASMALYGFPSAKEQASPTWLGGGANGAAAKALTQQANFLKEQGRLQTVAPDYSKNVTVEWVTKAM
jgi:taurine transport system substrate-binding protein